jgi:hypothetical protein
MGRRGGILPFSGRLYPFQHAFSQHESMIAAGLIVCEAQAGALLVIWHSKWLKHDLRV